MGIVNETNELHIIESAVDWLTLTAIPSRGGPSLSALGKRLVTEEAEHGAKRKAWHWRTYAGEHAGGVSWGTGTDGELLQLTGGAADWYFDRTTSPRWRCTRIDVQVTCRFPSSIDAHIEGVFNGIASSRPQQGFAQSSSLIKTTQGGFTCYVGTPGSERLGRIYNKERESQHERYRNAARWEVECRGVVASSLRNHLAASADRRDALRRYVHTYFIGSGIKLPWNAGGVLLHCDRPPRNAEAAAKLAWLSNTVAPTVQRLADAGHLAEVLSVLFGSRPDLWADLDLVAADRPDDY